MEQALHVCRAAGSRMYEGDSLWFLGRLYFLQGDYIRALTLVEGSLHISLDIKYAYWESLCLVLAGFIMHQQGHDEAAWQYGQRAIGSVEEETHFDIQSIAWCVLGHAAVSLCQWDEAVQAYMQSLEKQQKVELFLIKNWVN